MIYYEQMFDLYIWVYMKFVELKRTVMEVYKP